MIDINAALQQLGIEECNIDDHSKSLLEAMLVKKEEAVRLEDFDEA